MAAEPARRRKVLTGIAIAILCAGGLVAFAFLREANQRRIDEELYNAAMAGRPESVRSALAHGGNPRAPVGAQRLTLSALIGRFLGSIRGDDDRTTFTILRAMDRRLSDERTHYTKQAQDEMMEVERRRLDRAGMRDIAIIAGPMDYNRVHEAIEQRTLAHLKPFVECRHLLQRANRH